MSGGDEKLKSALDIALERAKQLGRMSAEEKQRLKEEELAAMGQALGKRYLSGLPVRDVDMELGKYKEGRRIIVRYLLSFLVDKIDVRDAEGAERILEAIQHFSADSIVAQSIRTIIQEYQGAIEQAFQENRPKLEGVRRKELATKGISGSAVKPAIESSPEWLQVRQELDAYYRKRFEEMATLLPKAL